MRARDAIFLAIATIGFAASAQERHPGGYPVDDPDWRFVLPDRPVKVVLLAGSIGAYPDMPYARLLHNTHACCTTGASAPRSGTSPRSASAPTSCTSASAAR
jgi:hypothetical protein